MLAHDSDPFNQWEASQRLGLRYALKAIAASGEASAEILPPDFIEAMRRVLRDDKLDAAFKDLVLTLPSESYIAEQLAEVDPQRVHAVREAMILQLASALQPEWESLWEANRDTGAYRPDHVSSRPPRKLAALYPCCACMPLKLATRSGPARPTSAARTLAI